jgi:triacylglycerol lipase
VLTSAVLLGLPLAAARAPHAGRDPILFVHGWRGSPAQWHTMMERFRADGWSERELYAWSSETGESNAVAAARIAGQVDQILAATGAARVDIVSHSMGALSTRYYIKELEGAGKVDAWVSIGAPNHGTTRAGLCFSTACREMRPGSRFLAALNAGDETPGAVRYATWSSPCDEIISPSRSGMLAGAVNHRTWCVSHVALLGDTAVYREVRDFVRGRANGYVGGPAGSARTFQRTPGAAPAITASRRPALNDSMASRSLTPAMRARIMYAIRAWPGLVQRAISASEG